MTASLTDRYVAATVRGLDEAQRPEVERELHATIEDMVDARLEAARPPAPTPSTPSSSSSVTPCGWPPATAVAPCTSLGRASTPSGSASCGCCSSSSCRSRGSATSWHGSSSRTWRRRPSARSSAAPSHWPSRWPSTSCSGRPSSSSSSSAPGTAAGHVDARPASRHGRHGPGRLRRDRGKPGLPRPRGPRTRLAADQPAGDQRKRVGAGARPGVVARVIPWLLVVLLAGGRRWRVRHGR